MLQVIISWIYIAVTAFLIGFAVLLPFEKLGFRFRRVTGIWMAGLVAVTVYAQIWSLWAGVGLWANLLLLCICAGIAIADRRRILAFLKNKWNGYSVGQRILLAALTVVMVYGASRGYQHTDTGLYHAQAIRWIEEYGVVPGLGNLHSRFGYNSSAFALCALYSLKWLVGDSLHAVQSFMAWMLLIECMPLFSVWKRGPRVSDFMRAGTVYYLTMLYQEMISPASDYFAMLMLLYVFINWLELAEGANADKTAYDAGVVDKAVSDVAGAAVDKVVAAAAAGTVANGLSKRSGCVHYALLCLLLVWGMTVKMSTAVILLLVIGPAVWLLREKRWKEIALYLSLGLGIALPWLIRGVLISGWLFYPFTFIDLFSVDWKIRKGVADFDAREIQVYARGIFDVMQYDQPFGVWIRNWFAALSGLEKLWVLAGAASAVLAVVSVAVSAAEVLRERPRKRRVGTGSWKPGKQIDSWDWILFGSIVLIGWFFWLYSAPLVRYGYAYVIALPMAAGGYWYCRLLGTGVRLEKAGKGMFPAVLLLFLAYKAVTLTQGILLLSDQPYYIRQQGYGEFEYDTYEVDGVTIYLPVYDGWIGYEHFPSSPYVQQIELRGEGEHAGDLKYGFREKLPE